LASGSNFIKCLFTLKSRLIQNYCRASSVLLHIFNVQVVHLRFFRKQPPPTALTLTGSIAACSWLPHSPHISWVTSSAGLVDFSPGEKNSSFGNTAHSFVWICEPCVFVSTFGVFSDLELVSRNKLRPETQQGWRRRFRWSYVEFVSDFPTFGIFLGILYFPLLRGYSWYTLQLLFTQACAVFTAVLHAVLVVRRQKRISTGSETPSVENSWSPRPVLPKRCPVTQAERLLNTGFHQG